MESILNSKSPSGRMNGVQVVGGSNPLTPTMSLGNHLNRWKHRAWARFEDYA
jgi:hypothetical protein